MFGDFQPAPNITARPDLYELENRALDPDGLVLAAMRTLAPWQGKILVDLGCGTGYWLPVYADEAATVVGVEPHMGLLEVAARRDWRALVVPGSAEHAERIEVMSSWQFASRSDLEAVLRLEFPGPVAARWLAGNPGRLGLTYGYVLFAVRRR